jgi:hypothetical protein
MSEEFDDDSPDDERLDEGVVATLSAKCLDARVFQVADGHVEDRLCKPGIASVIADQLGEAVPVAEICRTPSMRDSCTTTSIDLRMYRTASSHPNLLPAWSVSKASWSIARSGLSA